MNGFKLLIDTNILIGLEDNKLITSSFTELSKKCQQYQTTLFVHEASKQDIERDRDLNRRAITLSKLNKFPLVDGIHLPSKESLESVYGPIKSDNDHIDVVLLYTVHKVNATDFLVTEDRGIHKRALSLNISDRIFNIEDALVWLRNRFEDTSVSLPYIEEKKCHQVNTNDNIFASLRDDYAKFDDWFQKSCAKNHRECWTIGFDDEIAGIAIRKNETFADIQNKITGFTDNFANIPDKILKICTFKIQDKYRGEKFGEQLLKQILWWSNKNNYGLIYLSVYPKHKTLIDLLVQYGFESIGRTQGELYLGKVFHPGVFNTPESNEPLHYHRQYYPGYLSHNGINKYLVPIQSNYYSSLFPENIKTDQLDLFDFSTADQKNKIPGNSIRKVYVCKTPTASFAKGDLLFFFHLKDEKSAHSQSLITIGIIDHFEITDQPEEIIRLTAKRSVFTDEELSELTHSGTKQVKVINFLLAGHLNPALSHKNLQMAGLKGNYQSVRKIPHEIFKLLERDINQDVKTF